MFGRSMIRTLALTLAVTALPATALAAGPDGREGAGKDRAGAVERGGKGEDARAPRQFPMKGADFITMVDGRIQKVRAKVQEKIAKKGLPEAVQKQVMAEVDAGSAKVKAAATKAAADGTVTKDEAKEVHDLAKQVKKDLRAKAGLPDHDRGKGHGKGKGKGKA